MTSDGRRLLFQSSARVTAFDNRGHAQIYLAVGDAAPTCISCGIVGEQATAAASLGQQELMPVIAHPRNISDDGRWIFFQSGDPLVAEDRNGVQDVYQWHDGRISLVSSGLSSDPSKFVGVTRVPGSRSAGGWRCGSTSATRA